MKKVKFRSYYKKRGFPLPGTLLETEVKLDESFDGKSDSYLERQLSIWAHNTGIAQMKVANFQGLLGDITSRRALAKLRKDNELYVMLGIKYSQIKGKLEGYKALFKIYQANWKTISRVISLRISERNQLRQPK